jgi:hypothetical protein
MADIAATCATRFCFTNSQMLVSAAVTFLSGWAFRMYQTQGTGPFIRFFFENPQDIQTVHQNLGHAALGNPQVPQVPEVKTMTDAEIDELDDTVSKFSVMTETNGLPRSTTGSQYMTIGEITSATTQNAEYSNTLDKMRTLCYGKRLDEIYEFFDTEYFTISCSYTTQKGGNTFCITVNPNADPKGSWVVTSITNTFASQIGLKKELTINVQPSVQYLLEESNKSKTCIYASICNCKNQYVKGPHEAQVPCYDPPTSAQHTPPGGKIGDITNVNTIQRRETAIASLSSRQVIFPDGYEGGIRKTNN